MAWACLAPLRCFPALLENFRRAAVKQIVDLYKTFPKHEEIERYKAIGHYRFGGLRYVDREDYRQNLRLSSQTDTLCSKLIKDMQASIDRLDQ